MLVNPRDLAFERRESRTLDVELTTIIFEELGALDSNARYGRDSGHGQSYYDKRRGTGNSREHDSLYSTAGLRTWRLQWYGSIGFVKLLKESAQKIWVVCQELISHAIAAIGQFNHYAVAGLACRDDWPVRLRTGFLARGTSYPSKLLAGHPGLSRSERGKINCETGSPSRSKQTVLQSTSIRLLVGEDRKEFLVHRKILEKNLTGLHILSRERFIEFDGDEESIGYLLEFLYTGDYGRADAADSALQNGHAHSHPEPGPATDEPVHPIVLAARTSPLGVWGKPAAVHTKFHHGKSAPPSHQHITPTAVVTNGIASPPASPFMQQKEDSLSKRPHITAPSFLVHARVYLLADRYGAIDLKDLSLRKLRAALDAFQADSPVGRTAILIKFIKDVYDLPTGTAGDCQTENKLRDVVVVYTVAHLSRLQADSEFKAYVKGGGDFVVDLFTTLASVKSTSC
ncbi:hypothetical protein GP486_007404 [Trichoglossum hirsutum]|uniref:BTB domain-containing protein n=1 Tax=Trichoglossum hirsutum TaxID=265104 RepID=A0A9P8L7M0_9PEZI|nr:hypothetical protein GP486_007404 [Trichoglossum hirsutum]